VDAISKGSKKRKGSDKAGLSTIQLSSPVDVGYYVQMVRTM
jgi:hypothetical protein